MHKKKTVLLLLLLPVLSLAALDMLHHEHATAGEIPKNKSVLLPPTSTFKTTSDATNSPLARDMNSVINNANDLSVAASVIDLNTGKEYDAGATTMLFKAASTAKVLTAIDYLHEVELGQATLHQTIDGSDAEQLMQAMIEVSDDNAWSDFNDYLGDQQQGYADSIGLNSFTGGEYNTMTTADMAKLLQELYDGKLINASDQSLLYSFMANTTSTNLIQAALPPGATVYHKYGQLWGYLNDAAIVQYQGHNFVLVIYTNNSDGTNDEYDDQVTLIHDITQEVFKDITAENS